MKLWLMHWGQVVTSIVNQLFAQQSSVNKVVLINNSYIRNKTKDQSYLHLNPGVDNPG